jgi:putative MATE family efflux protein
VNDPTQRTREITEGAILPAVLRLAGPVILSITLQTSYQLVNTFWVGRLGGQAVAAISVTAPMFFFLLVLGSGLSIAGSVFVAQYSGARQPHKVNHVAAQTIVMVACLALLVSTAGYLLARPALRLIGVPPEVLEPAAAYLKISYFGMLFSYGFMMFQAILQGVGEVRFPLRVVAASVVLNAVLDPWFIFGWGPIRGLGVTGAALATVGAQGFAALLGVGVLFTGRYGIRVRLRDFKPDLPFIRRALAVGLPASVEQATRSLGAILLTWIATGFGTTALAAYGLGSRLIMFFFVPSLGLSQATATVVGQNIGARKVERAAHATRLTGWLTFWAMTLVGLAFMPLARPLSAFLVPTDHNVVELGAAFVRVVAPAVGIIAAQQVIAGALRGAGQTMAAMVLSLMTQWLLQLPISYALARHTSLGFAGIWWAFPIANAISLLASIAWFQRGTWRHTRLTEEGRLAARVSAEAHAEEGVP